MPIYSLAGKTPRIAASAWIADSAVVIGDVLVEEGASVWFNVVIRADNAPITVGRNSNIQDGSVLHTDEGIELTIGNDVSVGHMAMLHGCSVGDGALIGIGAILLNRAEIGASSLVGAGALVTERKRFADRSMIIGNPAKAIKELTAEQVAGLANNAKIYVSNSSRFRTQLEPVSMTEANAAYEA